nr:Os03g0749650 [Ipomoea trifida]
MNCINAINDGNPKPTRNSPTLKPVHHVDPVLRRGFRLRPAAAAAQHTADGVISDDLSRQILPVNLRHLSDLLRQRHPPHQVPDPASHAHLWIFVNHVFRFCPRRHARTHQQQ